jgi:hypothetical protein
MIPNDWDWQLKCIKYNRSQKCNHLKGNLRGSRKDYCVSFHTFIDGSQRIACLKGCGFEVFNKPEWSFKWAVGVKMVMQSTNTASASERIPRVNPTAPAKPIIHSKEEIEDAYTNSNDEKDIIRGWVNKSGNQPEGTDDIIIL